MANSTRPNLRATANSKMPRQASNGEDAEFRFLSNGLGTVCDIKIDGWRLDIKIPSVFRLKDVYRYKANEPDTVGFELELERKNPGRLLFQYLNAHNQVDLKVHHVPKDQGISKIVSLFREMTDNTICLRLTFTAVTKEDVKQIMAPFEFKYHPAPETRPELINKSYGQCIVFTADDYDENVHPIAAIGSPEAILHEDPILKAHRFCPTPDTRGSKLVSGNVTMWSTTAVGYREANLQETRATFERMRV